ncbi:MAG: hypothetical protein B7Y45_00180 [Sphingomonas sp. 28-66-16]|nr:MAG: hypothetical protein B7Y45_00180 [Sphingomonas sp. 28-66-16]
MHFDLLQSISLAGHPDTPNDDRVGCGDALAWVIDGATDLGEAGLLGARGGAAWLAMEANSGFASAGDGSIDSICKGVFARVARRFDAQRTRDPVADWELPLGAFLIARVGAATIEYGWLGDCVGLLRRGEKVVWVGPQAGKDQESAWAARFVGQGLGEKERPEPILQSLRQSRSRSGKHLLGVDPTAAAHLDKAVIPCAPGDELLLMTDGFAALIEGYAALTPEAMMAALSVEGLAGLGKQLREIEAADAACTRYPRFKQSDDATAIWLRVAA